MKKGEYCLNIVSVKKFELWKSRSCQFRMPKMRRVRKNNLIWYIVIKIKEEKSEGQEKENLPH